MRIHPITGMPLEDGSGAWPDDQQALVLHCGYIEQTQGKEAADAMRGKVHAFMTGEQTEYQHEHPTEEIDHAATQGFEPEGDFTKH